MSAPEATLGHDEREWIRSRPEAVQATMRIFPPMCIVRARPEHTLIVPPPGGTGQVTSYYEDGTLGVSALYNEAVRYQCASEWLEAVSWATTPDGVQLTPALMAAVLDERPP